MKELNTKNDIQASPEKVWQILSDLNRWADWNPSFRVNGKAALNEDVEIISHSRTFHGKVVTVEENRRLTWKYHLILPFLFQGEQSFTIEALDTDHVHVTNTAVFNGWLVPLVAKNIETQTRQDMENMDKALKNRAEQDPYKWETPFHSNR